MSRGHGSYAPLFLLPFLQIFDNLPDKNTVKALISFGGGILSFGPPGGRGGGLIREGGII